MNSYVPPHGSAPPMEKVLAPGPEGSQEINDHWRPFNRGKPAVDHMHDLYPIMLRIPAAVRADVQGEEYSVPIPGGYDKRRSYADN